MSSTFWFAAVTDGQTQLASSPAMDCQAGVYERGRAESPRISSHERNLTGMGYVSSSVFILLSIADNKPPHLTDLEIEDIGSCSQKFWDCLSDPILAVSGGASNIIVWHVNLFHGTLAPLLRRRPDLQPIIERTLKGDLMGKWLLSEVAHGLDVTNIETTATKVSDGFILHTPHPRAAK